MTDAQISPGPCGLPVPAARSRTCSTLWRRERIFARARSRRTTAAPSSSSSRARRPPTTRPTSATSLTRVVKDLFPRFQTMRGQPRRAQGRLGHPRPGGRDRGREAARPLRQAATSSSSSPATRAPRSSSSTAPAYDSVMTYERQWRAMTERVGYWVDLDDAYFTYSNGYVESVWWALGRLTTRGCSSRGTRVQPYCARCGTTLSSHEVAQNYKEHRGSLDLGALPGAARTGG